MVRVIFVGFGGGSIKEKISGIGYGNTTVIIVRQKNLYCFSVIYYTLFVTQKYANYRSVPLPYPSKWVDGLSPVGPVFEEFRYLLQALNRFL